MFNQFKPSILTACLFLTMGFLSTAARPEEPQGSESKEHVLITGLTVTKTSSTSVGLSWSGWPGAGDYTVSVLNLTTSQLEQQFTTSNTTTPVSNLVTGDTYRFSVEKAGYVIAEDLIM